MFKIMIHSEALKELKKLHPAFQYAVTELARKLTRGHIPPEHDIRKVSGIESTYYVRIGKYGVFYYVDLMNGKIYILHIRKII